MKWNRRILVLFLAALSVCALGANDHDAQNTAQSPDIQVAADSLSFAELGRYYHSQQASSQISPRFSLDGGDCVVNPAPKVSSLFLRQRFNASIGARGATFWTPDLGNSPDETFHSDVLRLDFHQAEVRGGILTSSRKFTIPTTVSVTTTKPRFELGGFSFGSEKVQDSVERDHNVLIQQDSRKVMFHGEPSILLEAKGSGSFGWNETPLYYCVFPDKE